MAGFFPRCKLCSSALAGLFFFVTLGPVGAEVLPQPECGRVIQALPTLAPPEVAQKAQADANPLEGRGSASDSELDLKAVAGKRAIKLTRLDNGLSAGEIPLQRGDFDIGNLDIHFIESAHQLLVLGDGGDSVVADTRVRFYDLATRRACGELPERNVLNLALSDDGHTLVTEGGTGTVVWNLPSRRRVVCVGDMRIVELGPDAHRLALAHGFKSIVVVDTRTGAHLFEMPAAPRPDTGFRLPYATFSPNGEYLAAVDPQGGTSLWNCALGKQVAHLDKAGIVAFSPDGDRVAVSEANGGVSIYQVATGNSLAQINPPAGQDDGESAEAEFSENSPTTVQVQWPGGQVESYPLP